MCIGIEEKSTSLLGAYGFESHLDQWRAVHAID